MHREASGARARARRSRAITAWAATAALSLALGLASPPARAATAGAFSYGELQASSVGAPGCGANDGSEPAVRISPGGNVYAGSERGLGAGSLIWRGVGARGITPQAPCGLEFRGQPNASSGTGAGGGDIDLAVAPAPNPAGTYTLYVASLNGSSVSVARSTDDGSTFQTTPVQAGLPLDDREWIAADGPSTSLLTYTDSTTSDIDVLRSSNGGQTYSQVSQAIPSNPLAPDYRASNNQIGNIAINHSTGTSYQSYLAPSSPSGNARNEFFVAISRDLGSTWSQSAIPCSVAGGGTGLDHAFPNITVDQSSGRVWAAWSDDTNVYTARSDDQARTWTCLPPVSTTTARAIFPWIAARNGGADLVFYGTPDRSANPTWYVEFAQILSAAATRWGDPAQLMPVHTGAVCESGANCTSQRQLFDDFGLDIDSSGRAHIAYSHDAPDLGGGGSFTGYAVQTAGTLLASDRAAGAPTGAGPGPGGGAGSGAAALPAAACLRGRAFTVRFRRPRHGRIRSVTVLVDGRRVRRVRGAHGGRVRVRLRHTPRATIRVDVVVRVLQAGRVHTLTTTRSYHACHRRRHSAPRRRRR